MFTPPPNNNLIRISLQGFSGAGGTGGSGAFTADHFIGNFNQTTHTIQQGLRQNPATDINENPPSNLFVIAYRNFTSPNYLLRSLRQHSNIDLPAPPISETNTNFIAKFTPTNHTVLRSLRQNSDNDINTDDPNNLFVIAYKNFTPPNRLLRTLTIQHPAHDIQAPPNFNEPSNLFVIAYSIFNKPHFLLKTLRHHQDFNNGPPSGSVRSITIPNSYPHSKSTVTSFRSITRGRI